MKILQNNIFLRFFIVLNAIIALFLAIYSFVLIDPNITLVNNKIWATIREVLVSFGYYQRNSSSLVFLALIVLLFTFHIFFIKNAKKINIWHVAIPIAIITVLSYPFLSHDFFNYLFDAKIFTFYHQNPYLHKALDFPGDPWTRFMQWTHRTYPYGPSWLVLSFVPSFLSFGKFILAFVFFKVFYALFFIVSVFLLDKLNKKWAVIFATSPLIIIEGLINAHNDFIALSLAIIGIYFLHKKGGWARLFLLISGGIKYITLPLMLLPKTKKQFNHIVLATLTLTLIYLSFSSEIQPWYFLALFALLPFYEELITNLNIFFVGLLFSYYPYVRYGDWGNQSNVHLKHNIIITFFILNTIYLLILKLKPTRK